MTAVSKPLYWSVGVPFNELFWASSTGALTENQANLLYLQKTVVDTASALETFSGGLLTNSVGALTITSNLGIATSQTSGILNIGTLPTREAAGVINIGASGGLHTIVMDTSSLANTNASPAIAIGTSTSAKTIKINNNTNSVHCSSIDLKGASINHITPNSATPITIGDGQTDSIGGILIGCSVAGNVRTSAPIRIGNDSTFTGSITMGFSSTNINLNGTTTAGALRTGSLDNSSAILIGATAPSLTIGNASSTTSMLGTTSISNFTTDALTRATAGLLSIGTTVATSMSLGRSACPVSCDGLLTATNGLTMGSSNNITLGNGTVAPTSGQIGFITNGTLSNNTGASGNYLLGTLTFPTVGIYVISFVIQLNCTTLPTSGYIQLQFPITPPQLVFSPIIAPNFGYSSTTLVSPAIVCSSGSFTTRVTTAGVLNLQNFITGTGVIGTSLSYMATRIA